MIWTICSSGNLARRKPASASSHPSLNVGQMAACLSCIPHCQTSCLTPAGLNSFIYVESLFWVITQLWACVMSARRSLTNTVWCFSTFGYYSWCADLQHVLFQISSITTSLLSTIFTLTHSAPLDFEKNWVDCHFRLSTETVKGIWQLTIFGGWHLRSSRCCTTK